MVTEYVLNTDNIQEFNDNYKRIYDEKWNFKDRSMKELVHGIHPYPAMMMPLIARTMFDRYGKKNDTVFLDPYVGSGTTIVEAQYYGVKRAIGIDLNPLAILISRTKTEDIDLDCVKEKIKKYKTFIKNIKSYDETNFSIRDSWFSKETISDLSKIKEFIKTIKNQSAKDFFNTCFSEVVRITSETRNGEFKLYRMPKKSLEKFNPDAINLFEEIINRNYDILSNKQYENKSIIELYNENIMDLPKHSDLCNSVDLIITSPPYGDSHTTVAYGQFSRLSNEWLDFEDAVTLDKRLLGGKKIKDKSFGIKELDDAIEQIKINDKNFNRDRYWEVVSFYNDYENSIKAIVPTVKKGGYVIFVVGNRRVRNVELQLDVITYKMFEKFGFEHEITHVRDILNKRMPSKASPENSKGGQIPTMTQEYIVVMHRK